MQEEALQKFRENLGLLRIPVVIYKVIIINADNIPIYNTIMIILS